MPREKFFEKLDFRKSAPLVAATFWRNCSLTRSLAMPFWALHPLTMVRWEGRARALVSRAGVFSRLPRRWRVCGFKEEARKGGASASGLQRAVSRFEGRPMWMCGAEATPGMARRKTMKGRPSAER